LMTDENEKNLKVSRTESALLSALIAALLIECETEIERLSADRLQR
jgi:hypothetical protein